MLRPCSSRLLLAGAAALSALPAATASAPADAGRDCFLRWRPAGVLVFAGYAVNTETSRPAGAIMLTCTVSNARGSYASTTSAPGYAVTTSGSGYLQNGGIMTTCTDVRTVYLDGGVDTFHHCVVDEGE